MNRCICVLDRLPRSFDLARRLRTLITESTVPVPQISLQKIRGDRLEQGFTSLRSRKPDYVDVSTPDPPAQELVCLMQWIMDRGGSRPFTSSFFFHDLLWLPCQRHLLCGSEGAEDISPACRPLVDIWRIVIGCCAASAIASTAWRSSTTQSGTSFKTDQHAPCADRGGSGAISQL
jgi:hypothetical protein